MPVISTTPPAVPVHDQPTTARRAGHVLSLAINGGLLWLVHQLPAWDWPAFLTDDFTLVVGIISVSLVATMLAEGVYLFVDRGRVRALGDLVTTSFGLAASIRVWDVFPFDFSGYAVDWTWLVRTLLVVAIVGSLIAIVVHLVRLARPEAD